MRLDVWLHKVCLVKSRSQAKQGCHSGKILLEGAPVKESHALRVGETLSIQHSHRELILRVLALPEGNLSKKEAPACYEVLAERPLEGAEPL